MPRPHKCRYVERMPVVAVFKPAGIPKYELKEEILTLDEFEAVRLADLLGSYQEEAATAMGISRQTFGNILAEAHRKIADCLVNGKSLRIEGGKIEMNGRTFFCEKCRSQWPEPCGTGRPERCPRCGNDEIYRAGRSSGGHCTPGESSFNGGSAC